MIDELVSVIMPAYNAKKTIRQAIESVFIQKDADWELIIVDDGSTDGTADVVRGLCRESNIELVELDHREKSGNNENKRIEQVRVFLILKPNSGVASARNTAINIAKGQYLAFLDSDDIWYEDKLKKQIKVLNSVGAAISYGACDVVDENGDQTGLVRKVSQQLSFDEALYGNQMACSTVMIDRKQLTSQPRFQKMGHEDYALWLSVLRGDYSEGLQQTAYGISEPIAAYRQTAGSLSGNKKKAAEWTYSIYRDYLKLPFLKRIGCFIVYAFRATRKRI